MNDPWQLQTWEAYRDVSRLGRNTADAECTTVEAWLRSRIADGLRPEEIAIFVRSEKELPRAHKPPLTPAPSFLTI